MSSLLNGIGTLTDRWKLALLRQRAVATSPDAAWDLPGKSTREYLQSDVGLSSDLVDSFFRPWFAGVFLEPDLSTSARFFDFTFRMFALGDAALPAAGMQAIPQQLASALPNSAVKLNRPVSAIDGRTLRFADGAVEPFDAVVIATEGPSAAGLSSEVPPVESRSTVCLYFAAERAPVDEGILILNGDGQGPVNNCCVPSNVAPSYAPAGAALVGASVIGVPHDGDLRRLCADVQSQLSSWFGSQVRSWRHLKTYVITYALPGFPPGAIDGEGAPPSLSPGLYCCGDHRLAPSINGAMLSGRRAAEAILADWSQAAHGV